MWAGEVFADGLASAVQQFGVGRLEISGDRLFLPRHLTFPGLVLPAVAVVIITAAINRS
jgi:hypothetical protein